MDQSNYQRTISTSPSSFEGENEEGKCTFSKDFDLSFPSKVTQAINRVLNKNEQRKSYQKIIRKQSKKIFSSSTVPLISLKDYMSRIVQMTEIEESVVVSAMIYLDRICSNKITLIHFNIHKLLFTAIMVAIKYNHDSHYSNSTFSEIGGIPLNDLNKMEYTFLNLIGYQLFISEDFYIRYHQYLTDIILEDE